MTNHSAKSICFSILLIGVSSTLFAQDFSLCIGKIHISRKNVFETGSPIDQQFPYSWGNKLHIVTTENFIRQELLFQEGSPLDLELVKESERLLRSRPIFRYVKITVQEPINGFADVLIETEDVWTTSIQLSYSIAGGKSSYSIGILEQNFLGSGKVVGAFLRKDIDRTTRGLSYRDPQFLGTRWDLFAGYGRDEKGREWESHLERPFYSALSRHSEGISYDNRDDEDRLFQNGDEVAAFRHKVQEMRAFFSYAVTAKQSFTRRISLAHERKEDEFSKAEGPGAPALPANRRINPILIGFDSAHIQYHKIRGVTTFDRDEDVNLGLSWLVEAGPFNRHFGATERGWLGRFTAGKNFHPREDQVWFNALGMDGRLDEQNKIQDGILRVRSQYFLLDWLPKHTASLRGEYILSNNLDPENQFLLGGENGLRGYSVRQFAGSRRALFALENRRVVLYDWLHLVSIGWAVFVDAGAVWEEKTFPDLNRFKSDVGAGIRFAPSRSVNPGLIRMDVAYALQDNDRKSRFVLNIGADLSFGEKRVRKFEQ